MLGSASKKPSVDSRVMEYEVYLRQEVFEFLRQRRGDERDIEKGRLVTNEQMKARITEWTAN